MQLRTMMNRLSRAVSGVLDRNPTFTNYVAAFVIVSAFAGGLFLLSMPDITKLGAILVGVGVCALIICAIALVAHKDRNAPALGGSQSLSRERSR